MEKILKINEDVDLNVLEKYGFYKNDSNFCKKNAYYYDGERKTTHKIIIDVDRTIHTQSCNTETMCVICELSENDIIRVCEKEKKSKTDKIIELLEKNVNSNGNIDCRELLEILKERK